jgi:hypothetical protein
VSYRPSNLVLWFGVGGGAVAWALQFVAGLGFSFAQCVNGNTTKWHVPVRDWQVGLASAGFIVGIASMAVAATIFRRTYRIGDIFGEERRGDGSAPPLGRIHFLSMVGLIVNLLVLFIMVMDAIGTALHGLCIQS